MVVGFEPLITNWFRALPLLEAERLKTVSRKKGGQCASARTNGPFTSTIFLPAEFRFSSRPSCVFVKHFLATYGDGG